MSLSRYFSFCPIKKYWKHIEIIIISLFVINNYKLLTNWTTSINWQNISESRSGILHEASVHGWNKFCLKNWFSAIFVTYNGFINQVSIYSLKIAPNNYRKQMNRQSKFQCCHNHVCHNHWSLAMIDIGGWLKYAFCSSTVVRIPCPNFKPQANLSLQSPKFITNSIFARNWLT